MLIRRSPIPLDMLVADEPCRIRPFIHPSDVPFSDMSSVASKKLGFIVLSIPRPPPAAMAVALNTAAALRESSSVCRRSTTASRSPSTLYGLAICSKEQSICGVHKGDDGAANDDV